MEMTSMTNLLWQPPMTTRESLEHHKKAGGSVPGHFLCYTVIMGCKGSKVQVVEVKPTDGRKSGWGAHGKGNQIENKSHENSSGRDGSATSKGTMDSGLGMEDESARENLPGVVTEKASSPRTAGILNNGKDSLLLTSKSQQERQTSSHILEELMTQGIIQSKTKVVKNGEAYDVMLETMEKPLGRPPAKLEKLKTKKTINTSLTKEDIESKMKAAEERRKTKEEELKKRLRSDRPVTALRGIRGEGPFSNHEQHEDPSTIPHETLDSSGNAMSENIPSMGPPDTLDFDASENVMNEMTHSQMVNEAADEIVAVESDITYNNPNVMDIDAGSDDF
ncbi:stathmin domain-containing 1 [Pelobates cultripes]|uniref:Stathmin domain-containing 1 n=1 Tax=Pelobates cultripes TaxID=61616 RepID=A0AAD1RZS1_PELCU|nr:stathmin domain-containing 1 [Pelobates cultripes]